ncbi:MAG: GDSL-type esterase/lipase family protein [Anaerovoracaceae bacterium]|jgi:lysophospholipase L1-like esterase
MKKIICYGDSNTYGYVPENFFGGRYTERERWTGILAEEDELLIVEAGMNGREIPTGGQLISFDHILDQVNPFDLITIMLGSNDLLYEYGITVEDIAGNMEVLLRHALDHPSVAGDAGKLLLIAPPPFALPEPGAEELCRMSEEFAPRYRQVAEETGVHFADAGSWDLGLTIDGVHFSPEGHRSFADHMKNALREIFPESASH